MDWKPVNDYINNIDSDEILLNIRLHYFVNSVEPDENVSFLTLETAIFAKLTTTLSDGNIWLMYGQCSKFGTLSFLCSRMKCCLYGLGVRIVNREDPDQTAYSEAVWSVSALFVIAFFVRQLV